MNANEQLQNNGWIKIAKSEGFLLAIIPFFGSLITLAFEKGYLSFYDVPTGLIQLDLARVLSASAIVAVFLSIYFLLVNYTVLLVRGKHPVRRALTKPFAAILVVLPLFYFTPKPLHWWGYFCLYFILLLAIQFIPPLFNRQKGLKYFERLEMQVNGDDDMNNNAEPNTPPKGTKLERYLITPVATMLFLLLIVLSMGLDHARSQDKYWVLKDAPDFLLVANYGEVMIFKYFDKNTKTIGEEVRVLKIQEGVSINLIRCYTGPLEAAKRKV